MAKSDMVKVTTLVNLKYDRAVKSAGAELSVRPEDVQDMVDKRLIEAPKNFVPPSNDGEEDSGNNNSNKNR